MSALQQWAFLEAELNGRAIVGQPGGRDPEYPCAMFEPGTPAGSDCNTDGHYMCRECVHAPKACAC